MAAKNVMKIQNFLKNLGNQYLKPRKIFLLGRARIALKRAEAAE